MAAHAPQRPAHRYVNGGLMRLLRIVGLLWTAFVLILLILDSLALVFLPAATPLPAHYYLLQVIWPLLILGLSATPQAHDDHGCRLFLLTIGLTATMPMLIPALVIPVHQPGPLMPNSGLLGVRALPILYLGLLLVAWQYQWRHMLAFCFGTAALGVVIQVLADNIRIGVPVVIMQTTAFLAFGYCMCLVIGRLREQSVALEQANRQLRHHASTLERLTISRERNHMARELHDTLAHTLSGLSVQLETIKAYLDEDDPALPAMVDQALSVTRTGLQETRRTLRALRASPLEDLGLRLALCELLRLVSEANQLVLTLTVSEQLPALAPDIEQCVYRIAQEALANITLHAGASALSVALSCEDDLLQLTISDNGRGFDPAGPVAPGHFGIAGMHERAALAGGRLSITSAPGAGTTIELELPV